MLSRYATEVTAKKSPKSKTPSGLRDEAEAHLKANRHEDAAVAYLAAAELYKKDGSGAAAKSMEDAAKKALQAGKKKKKSASSPWDYLTAVQLKVASASTGSALRVASRFLGEQIREYHRSMVASVLVEAGLVQAGALRDVSKLRYQAVFLMGAGGSGKGFVGQRWLKYMPGGGEVPPEKLKEKMKEHLTEAERGLSNLSYEKAVERLKSKGFKVEVVPGGGSAKIPFKLYTYDQGGRERLVDPDEYESTLPKEILNNVKDLKEVVFNTPVHELPSYWRQVNPDIYKEELAGYVEKEPGYVHEMSSEMSKAYFEAILESGDPVFIDGTGANPKKMKDQINAAKAAGYKTSVVLVLVPLTVNQIRNATRARNVDPNVIKTQWKAINDSFGEVRGVADRAKVIINRNDSADIATFQKNREKIDEFIARKTNYPTLYEYVKHEIPGEFSEWGPVLKK